MNRFVRAFISGAVTFTLVSLAAYTQDPSGMAVVTGKGIIGILAILRVSAIIGGINGLLMAVDKAVRYEA